MTGDALSEDRRVMKLEPVPSCPEGVVAHFKSEHRNQDGQPDLEQDDVASLTAATGAEFTIEVNAIQAARPAETEPRRVSRHGWYVEGAVNMLNVSQSIHPTTTRGGRKALTVCLIACPTQRLEAPCPSFADENRFPSPGTIRLPSRRNRVRLGRGSVALPRMRVERR